MRDGLTDLLGPMTTHDPVDERLSRWDEILSKIEPEPTIRDAGGTLRNETNLRTISKTTPILLFVCAVGCSSTPSRQSSSEATPDSSEPRAVERDDVTHASGPPPRYTCAMFEVKALIEDGERRMSYMLKVDATKTIAFEVTEFSLDPVSGHTADEYRVELAKIQSMKGTAHRDASGVLSGVTLAPEPTRTALLQEQIFRTDVHDALLVMALPRKPAPGETRSWELEVPKFAAPHSYGTTDILPARRFRWMAKLHGARGVALAWTTSAAKQTYAGADLEQWDESGTAEGRYAPDGFVEELRSSRTTTVSVWAAGRRSTGTKKDERSIRRVGPCSP